MRLKVCANRVNVFHSEGLLYAAMSGHQEVLWRHQLMVCSHLGCCILVVGDWATCWQQQSGLFDSTLSLCLAISLSGSLCLTISLSVNHFLSGQSVFLFPAVRNETEQESVICRLSTPELRETNIIHSFIMFIFLLLYISYRDKYGQSTTLRQWKKVADS